MATSTEAIASIR
ncbi:41bb0f6b-4316-401c-8dfd-6a49e5fdb4f5 [Thermothielavioides terrestris]|uniref:41bb0f6b-4316-401c-8dfd-6a49e5fdb4f5 n=1 Tax=Thermothielavioides terrestris TaxID=2587410 RepID=A0A446BID7_9PEZI|nr:41bb0f6b-4316-401c-8dfd-6a49e5fdb4f5 [Thermothielavioides terrestris]